MDPHRAERLAGALREELHEIVNFEVADPRVGSVEIAAIELSPDGRRAVVRVQTETDESLAALIRAGAFIRHQLAERLDLFRVPDLKFEAATNLGPPARIESLLKRAKRGRSREPFSATPETQKSPAE
ncbi:MAG: 30S ribosome-binding factor RbfA [Acidobacteria bacterium]|nr:30S ribosome-binding factor RbfA [Acidobacteriota bacterium]